MAYNLRPRVAVNATKTKAVPSSTFTMVLRSSVKTTNPSKALTVKKAAVAEIHDCAKTLVSLRHNHTYFLRSK
jgi:hypothetical protein